MLDAFEIDHAYPSWPVNRWLSAMLRAFRPQIEALLLERDIAVEKWARDHPDQDVFEDRELEITSQMSICVREQMIAIDAALRA